MGYSVEVPIAIAELIDKITILEIKVERICDATKVKNARAELAMLGKRRDDAVPNSAKLVAMTAHLRSVNERIWELEDSIRDCERRSEFGPDFIAFARSIYRTNDERAAIKRQINVEFDSALIEEKSYASYEGQI